MLTASREQVNHQIGYCWVLFSSATSIVLERGHLPTYFQDASLIEDNVPMVNRIVAPTKFAKVQVIQAQGHVIILTSTFYLSVEPCKVAVELLQQNW